MSAILSIATASRTRLHAFRAASRRAFSALDAAEVMYVASAVTFAERTRLRPLALAITRLGNGSLYPLLTLVVAATVDAPMRFTATAAASVLLAFSIYPLLKSFLARRRPCEYDPSLVRGGPDPLDRYSCPSGHAMTAAAWAVPLVFAAPAAAAFAIGLCALMSWSRVALGHHYVSDVVLGAAMGASIAVSVAAFAY